MKILITGSSGFVGKYLVSALNKKGHSLIKADITDGIDLTDWNQVKKIKKFDIVYHLAAISYVPQSYKDPGIFYNINLISTLNILELCRLYNAKMIFASSYVYGKPKYLPINEEHPVEAINPYAESKIIGERLCSAYNRDFGIDTVIVRPSNIYGKGLNENFLIPTIIKQIPSGKIILKDPRPKRDFIFISDLIEFYTKIIETNISNEIINCGSGISYSVEDITNMVAQMLKYKIEVVFNKSDRKIEVMETVYNIEKAKKLLNWKPRTPLKKGLSGLINCE
ncbi:NAD-dependent epimerase/dehydratase family protein [Bacteroidota bacterium]